MKDILRLQQEIVTAIVSSTSLAIKKEVRFPPAREIHPKAYESFLKGTFLVSLRAPHALPRAIECYQAAIALEPEWAPPYAGLMEGQRLWDFARHVPSAQMVANAKALAEKTLSLDPANAQAHASMGAVLAMNLWKWKEGESRIQLALRNNPQSSHIEYLYSMLLLMQGRYDGALRHVESALAIEHSSLFFRSHRTQILLFARRFGMIWSAH